MARKQTSLLAWTRCRGRNGWDAPQDIPADMGEECLNVDFYDGGLGRKRGGSADSGITAHAGLGSTLWCDIVSWVPGQDPSARELFAFTLDGSAKIGRVAAGSVATNITNATSVQLGGTRRTSCAALNGKLFMTWGTSRIYVYDPGYSTTANRVVGLATHAAAPTVANTGSGSYAAVARYYKTASTEQQSSVTVRRSELSAASTVFTPSGSGTHARITRPTAVNEGETHWEVYASADGVDYYGPIGTIAIATTTYDDNLTVTTYETDYDLAPVEGANKPFPGCKFLYSNGSRLFGLGRASAQDTSVIARQSGTVYFSPALDSSAIHDEERCQDTIDARGALVLGRNAGGVDRGLSGLGNIVVAFQSQGIYGLVPTEDADTPFRRVKYSDSIGAVSHQSLVQAEDELGRPCIYFLDPIKGPYRLGQDGLRWVGKDVYDVWSTVNLGADSTYFYPHGVYYQAKRQVWFWVNAGGSVLPSAMLVLDIPEQEADERGDLRGGWSKWTGTLTACISSAMMANTLGSTMSLDLKPYANSYSVSSATIYKADNATGDNVQAYIQSGGLNMAPIRNGITRSTLLAQASSGVTITQTFVRNFGDETNRTDTVSLTASGSESHVLKAFDASTLQDAYVFQVRLGDGSAAQNQWTLDRWYAHLNENEDV